MCRIPTGGLPSSLERGQCPREEEDRWAGRIWRNPYAALRGLQDAPLSFVDRAVVASPPCERLGSALAACLDASERSLAKLEPRQLPPATSKAGRPCIMHANVYPSGPVPRAGRRPSSCCPSSPTGSISACSGRTEESCRTKTVGMRSSISTKFSLTLASATAVQLCGSSSLTRT